MSNRGMGSDRDDFFDERDTILIKIVYFIIESVVNTILWSRIDLGTIKTNWNLKTKKNQKKGHFLHFSVFRV